MDIAGGSIRGHSFFEARQEVEEEQERGSDGRFFCASMGNGLWSCTLILLLPCCSSKKSSNADARVSFLPQFHLFLQPVRDFPRSVCFSTYSSVFQQPRNNSSNRRNSTSSRSISSLSSRDRETSNNSNTWGSGGGRASRNPAATNSASRDPDGLDHTF